MTTYKWLGNYSAVDPAYSKYMICEICCKSAQFDGVRLSRQNRFWRCREHLQAQIDKDVIALYKLIEDKNKRI